MTKKIMMQKYWSRSRLATLSKPKKPRVKYDPENANMASLENLDYMTEDLFEYTPLMEFQNIPSSGLGKLATPKRLRPKFVRVPSGPAFSVSENAKKYKASERITKMAKPRMDLGTKPKDNPYSTNQKAVTAKIKGARLKTYERLAEPPPHRKREKTA